jgi:hypothetical protein
MAYANIGTISTNTNINCASGDFADVMLTGSTNLIFQNCATAGHVDQLTVIVRQDPTGSRTLGYGNTIRWSDNIVPVLTTTANTMDVLQFMTYDGGTIWFGSQVMANIPLANIY